MSNDLRVNFEILNSQIRAKHVCNKLPVLLHLASAQVVIQGQMSLSLSFPGGNCHSLISMGGHLIHVSLALSIMFYCYLPLANTPASQSVPFCDLLFNPGKGRQSLPLAAVL